MTPLLNVFPLAFTSHTGLLSVMRIWLVFVLSVAAVDAATVEPYGRLPLEFEPLGPGRFVARSGGVALSVSATQATAGSSGMELAGADPGARAVPEEMLPGKSHYLVGNDRRRWRTGVPHYARVRFREVYPGIDVVYYGNRSELEFDFVVAPGADPGRIQVALRGSGVELREPHIYQGSQTVAGHITRRGRRVTFELAAYDRSRPLVIDPVLT